jgi:ATP-binding cassette subfamily F protein 3
MHVINLNRISISHAGRPVFADLTLAVGDRDRLGLVGPNGAGKSTLLRLIAGALTPDAGEIIRQRSLRIGMLPQDVSLPAGRTLIDIAQALPPRLADIERQLAALEQRLADPAVYDHAGRLEAALEQQAALLERFDRLGGAGHASRVRELLHRLGFTPDDYDLPGDTLSGGQKKLIALVRLALEAPDMLLLDEPDNHLDLRAKRYLEQFIRKYEGAVVIVSHDRYLLDETVTHIAELENGSLTVYTGSYSAYATERELRRLRQQQMYIAQQKDIARIEAAIARFEHWASIVVDERHIRQARSRRKMLDRMEANGEIIERVTEQRRMALQLEGSRGSTKALAITDLALAFDDDLLFVELNLLLRHGERIGLIGPNGAGKSALFRVILGEIEPLAGQVKIGPSTRIGYYAQEHQTLEAWLDRTPLELVRDIRPMPEGSAVAHLLKMAFVYDQVRQPVRTLSGGERSRLQLLCLMLQQPNLLLLDEPTNNLDILSAEVLEEALNDFDGAVLVISHDRYFLDRVVDEVVELRDGTLTLYPGGYTDYLAASGQA